VRDGRGAAERRPLPHERRARLAPVAVHGGCGAMPSSRLCRLILAGMCASTSCNQPAPSTQPSSAPSRASFTAPLRAHDPKVDLDTPVTNQKLVTVLETWSKGDAGPMDEAIWDALQSSVLLVLVLDDGSSRFAPNATGMMTLEKGSLLAIVEAIDDNDDHLLALFTDWTAARLFVTEKTVGMLMPANQAWDFALERHIGAVVNPRSRTALRLTRRQLVALKRGRMTE
jgi:hypothetical protein